MTENSQKNLIGACARRRLFKYCHHTESTTGLSDFEPFLENIPGATSTPACKEPKSQIAKEATILNTANSQHSSSRSETPIEFNEEPIMEATFSNANLTYGPRNRSKRFTNFNAVSMILTDDEGDVEEVVDNCASDNENFAQNSVVENVHAAKKKSWQPRVKLRRFDSNTIQRSNRLNAITNTKHDGNIVQNSVNNNRLETIVEPRPPIHKAPPHINTTVKLGFLHRKFPELPMVSNNQTDNRILTILTDNDDDEGVDNCASNNENFAQTSVVERRHDANKKSRQPRVKLRRFDSNTIGRSNRINSMENSNNFRNIVVDSVFNVNDNRLETIVEPRPPIQKDPPHIQPTGKLGFLHRKLPDCSTVSNNQTENTILNILPENEEGDNEGVEDCAFDNESFVQISIVEKCHDARKKSWQPRVKLRRFDSNTTGRLNRINVIENAIHVGNLVDSVLNVTNDNIGSFVEPRLQIHEEPCPTIHAEPPPEEPTVKLNFLKQTVSNSSVRFSNQTDDTAVEVAQQFSTQAPVVTEIFDDCMLLERISFKNHQPIIKAQKGKRLKKTPVYKQMYNNAKKTLQSKARKYHMKGSKRPLYTVKYDTTFNKSHDDATLTNAATTPPHTSTQETEMNAARQRAKRKRRNTSTSSDCSYSTAHSCKRIANTQHRSCSCSKEIGLRPPSKSSSEDESPVLKQSATFVLSRSTSRSPSLNLRLVSSHASSEEPTGSATQTNAKPVTKKSVFSTKKLSVKLMKLKHIRTLSQKQSPVVAQPVSAVPSRSLLRSSSQLQSETEDNEIESLHSENQVIQSSRLRKKPASKVQMLEALTTKKNPRTVIGAYKTKSSMLIHRSESESGTSTNRSGSPFRLRQRKQTTEPNYPNQTLRHCQRQRQPTKIEPYAIEIYSRCYFPEIFVNPIKNDRHEHKTKATNQHNNQHDKKRKNNGNNLQPRVKLRRIDFGSCLADHVSDSCCDNGTSVAALTETAPNDINTWLQSSNVCHADAHIDTSPHQYDGHFLSRELLLSEEHNDIEFRFYDSQSDDLNLGYMIFKPKVVKEMCSLKNHDLKLVCIFGEFRFKIKDKRSEQIRERYCAVGDVFEIYVGDEYGIENLSKTENGQIIVIKQKQIDN